MHTQLLGTVTTEVLGQVQDALGMCVFPLPWLRPVLEGGLFVNHQQVLIVIKLC